MRTRTLTDGDREILNEQNRDAAPGPGYLCDDIDGCEVYRGDQVTYLHAGVVGRAAEMHVTIIDDKPVAKVIVEIADDALYLDPESIRIVLEQ